MSIVLTNNNKNDSPSGSAPDAPAENGLGRNVVSLGWVAFFGVLLSPLLAGAAMGFSSVTVVTNANRLRSFHPRFSAK